MPKAAAEPAILAAVKADHDATLANMREPVISTAAPINSYFALVADESSVQIVAEAQIAYTKPLMAQTRWNNLPILSAAAPWKSGGRSGPSFYTDIPAGPLALKNIADIYLYPNTVQIVKISSADVRERLERAAGIFNRIDPTRSDEQPLINPVFPDGNWSLAPLPAGVNATFLTSPAAAGKPPASLKAEPAGDAPEGFAKYRLRG